MKIIGHRGARAVAPENTLKALRIGGVCADYVEVDARLTRDGVAVVLHDATLERTTNGSGPLNSLTLDEVRTLDAGGGERIPTLAEVCDFARGRCGLVVEIKEPGSEDTICGILREQNPVKLLVVSFHTESIRKARDLLPGIQTGYIFSKPVSDPVPEALEAGAAVILPKMILVTEALVRQAHENEFLVIPWTLNTPEQYRAAILLGVDGFASDDPCAARKYLDSI
jgi:glycerophosphoryl diester phosphodiesterase